MSCFPSDKHLASWAGVCPGNRQSGGKRLSGATTPGNSYLRAMLAEVVWVISHTKEPYADLGADYLEKLDTARIQQHHIHRLEHLGYTVTLTPKKLASYKQ